ncbi:trichohyalin-like isoform X2 [Clinocottus analis]|uniref:trichohyalin-like isoform X2 n=1 Tax=Clinocottus analis TaxID=304258 RepID=UPI0035C0037F
MSLKTTPATSPSKEELRDAAKYPGMETDDIKQLVHEFKGLYEQRLATLELDTSATREDLLQKKVNFLRSYVNDLTDQNQVLLQTIEDLQKEADYNVSNWGIKLWASDRILDVSKVDLRTLLVDELVGPASHVPHSIGSLVQITSEKEDLKIQLQTKDMAISELERNLRENFQQKQKTATQVLESSERLVRLQSELSCLQRLQKDNMKEIAEKDVCITKLRANIELLQREGADTHAQLSKLNVRTSELQQELRRKEEEWRQREDERRLKSEKENQEAEARRRQEQRRREEECVRKVEEKKREEEWRRGIEEEREAHTQVSKKWTIVNSELTVSRKQVELLNRELSESHQKEEMLLSEMKERDEHVRHLDQDVVGLRATQDSLKETLAMKEKHQQQLVQDNAQLKESQASLKSNFQTSECLLNDISKTLDRTKTSLDTERQQRQQIQDQLHHANKELEHLQQELIHVRHATEKQIQKREVKMCALVKEHTESKMQLSECQKELLQREKALEEVSEERDELRAKMEDRSRASVHANRTKDRLEADLSLSHEKVHTLHLEVRSRDQLILQLRAEMKTAEQKHQRKQEQVAALKGEVRHLKHKVRGHQDETCRLNQKVSDIERLMEQKEKEQQQLHDQLRIGQQQVETCEGKLKMQGVEMELLHQQLKGAKEVIKDADLQAQEQKETVAIFRQKYTAAIEKVHRVQGRVELLEEELQYLQQQLRDSQLATHSVKEELAEMEQRWLEKVGQWENAQEALDQLTDELQANQNLLRESQQKAEQLKGLVGSLQEQADTIKQQKLMLECDLHLYQQTHSHSDEEYLSLLGHREPLQKRCSEQVERLAECEKAILQMKSELERQAQQKAGLKQSLVANMCNRKQLEQEVIHLKKEVTHLNLELADTQKVHVALLRQSEEELKEARREAARRSSEVDAQRAEVQRLQEGLLKGEEKMRSAIREKQSLSSRVRRLSQELEELRCNLQVTVEELAARAEEARRMEGCLNEGKLAEEKIRLVAVRLDTEVSELRRNLQQAVDHKLRAEREKQEQVDGLLSELEGTRTDKANMRHESQLVMTNVNRWITEQKASNESLAAQMKAQSKLLLIVTEEKEHLQDSNDTLKAEVKQLKEVGDEKSRDMERFKAWIRNLGIPQEERTMEKQDCVARNISKIQDMQTRLRSNLEAIRMLNQQLNSLIRENKRLRVQLEEERSMRRQVERLLPPPPHPPPPPPPPTFQQSSIVHRPLSPSARPDPLSTSLFSSLRLPHPLSKATGDTDVILTQSKLSGARESR